MSSSKDTQNDIIDSIMTTDPDPDPTIKPSILFTPPSENTNHLDQTPQTPIPNAPNTSSAMGPKSSILSSTTTASSSSATPETSQVQTGNGDKDPHGAPGSTWNNKKALEEAEKATNVLTDKGFSMTHFGEILDLPLKE